MSSTRFTSCIASARVCISSDSGKHTSATLNLIFWTVIGLGIGQDKTAEIVVVHARGLDEDGCESNRVRISNGAKTGITAVCAFSSTLGAFGKPLSSIFEAEACREKSMIFVAAIGHCRMIIPLNRLFRADFAEIDNLPAAHWKRGPHE